MNEFQDISQILERVLIEIERTQKLVKQKEKPFLNIDEASEYLGISKATLYGYTHRNIIPYYKLQDRRLYFKIEDLNEWILDKKNKHKSNSEIKSEAVTRLVTER